MRQLKAFMKAKKRGRCKCLTLNMWRCGEFCGCVNECGDVNPTPPVPPVPGFTYTLEKTSTRGAKTIYTASKYIEGESNPIESYKLSIEELSDVIEIGHYTNDWESAQLNMYSDTISLYVNKSEELLTAGTQEAFKSAFDMYGDLYGYDDTYFYETMLGYDTDYTAYILTEKEKNDIGGNFERAYALILTENGMGEITEAAIAWGDGSFGPIDITDLSQAVSLKEEYDSIIANFSQAAFKRGLDDFEALYDSLQ